MITLLIDVVSNNSILALFDQKKSQKTIEKIRLDHNEMRSENVIPALDSLLDNSTYCYSDIKKVICVTGPGNYTNIRTGIAVAKSISLVNDIDAYGLTQHELIAQTSQYPSIQGDLFVIIHSMNEDFYYQEFESNIQKKQDPILLNAADIMDKIESSKANIIETGNEFMNYLIKKNIDLNNLQSNYLIPDSSLSKICALTSDDFSKIDAKYIKTPNFVKYTKKNIYE